MDDIVFLLGAGASRDAGYPLMAELSKGFEASLADTESEAEIALYTGIREELSDNSRRGLNIERIIQFCEQLRAFKTVGEPGASAVRAWNRPFNEEEPVVSSLIRRMRRHIKECLSAQPTEDPFYIGRLFEIAEHEPVDIFSLNYDRLVETVCARQNLRFTTGFSEVWDPALFDEEGWDVRLFKLHGSIDWYRVKPSGPIYRGGEEHFAFAGADTHDALIYPSLGKSTHADPYATLLQRFSDRLMEADLLVVVGYSFQDDHIRRLVTDRMSVNRTLQVLVVDPTAHSVVRTSGKESPPLAHFDRRVSGLWWKARSALENHRVQHRLSEISNIDHRIEQVRDLINRRQYKEAADKLVQFFSVARNTDFHLKALQALSLRGPDFLDALERRLAGMARGAAREVRLWPTPKIDERFPDAQGNHVGVPLISAIMAWTHSIAFGFERLAGDAEAVVKGIVTECLRGLPVRLQEGGLAAWKESTNLHGLTSRAQQFVKSAAASLSRAPIPLRWIGPTSEAQARLRVLNEEVPHLWKIWEDIETNRRTAIQTGNPRVVIYRDVRRPEAMADEVMGSVGSLVELWAVPPRPI